MHFFTSPICAIVKNGLFHTDSLRRRISIKRINTVWFWNVAKILLPLIYRIHTEQSLSITLSEVDHRNVLCVK